MAGALCGRITFQSDPVSALRKSFSPRGTGKGLLCVTDGDNARKRMYGKVSRNKHQVHPKSTRERHLLCVTLAGSDREKQLTRGLQRGLSACSVVSLRQDSFPCSLVSYSAKWGKTIILISQSSGDSVKCRALEDPAQSCRGAETLGCLCF